MAVEIVTKEDLREFKLELLNDLKELLNLQKQEPQRKWLKSNEVRELLGVSPGTLQTLRVNGTLRYTKLGGIIYYDFEHLEKLMADNTKEAYGFEAKRR